MNQLQVIKEENIASHIYFLRGHNIILDFDLASLYGVETRALKQAQPSGPEASGPLGIMQNLQFCRRKKKIYHSLTFYNLRKLSIPIPQKPE